jgi:hypothetical protein
MLAFKLRRYGRLDLIPGQSRREYRQRIVQIDHGVNAAAEKVLFLHHRFPQESTLHQTFPEGFGVHDLYKKASFHAGWRGFAGPLIILSICKRNPWRQQRTRGGFRR